MERETDSIAREAASLSRVQIAMLSLILLAGAFLRFYQIGHASLWMDEIWSIEMATGRGSLHDHLSSGTIQIHQIELTSLNGAPPAWKIWNSMQRYGHPPLYYLLLRAWMDVLGNGPAGARSLSALFSLFAVVVLFDICRLLQGTRVALLAAALMAFAPAQLDFAQDARNYTLLILLSLCCGDSLIRIEKFGTSNRSLLLLAIGLTALPVTHYFSIGVLLAMFAYAMIRMRGNVRVKTLGAFALSAILAVAIWGVPFYRQVHSMTSQRPEYLFEPGNSHLLNTLRRLIGLPGQLLVGEIPAQSLPPTVLVILAVLVLVLPLARLRWRRDLLFWVLWLAGTIGLAVAADLSRGVILLAYLRYTILASPAVYAILAGIDWPRRPVLRDIAALATLALMAMFCITRLSDPIPGREDWRGLSQYIRDNAAPDDLLVCYGNDAWIPPGTAYMAFRYYDPDSNHPWLILHRPAGPRLQAELQKRNSLWLIGAQPAADGRFILPGWQCTEEFRSTAGSVGRMLRLGPAHIGA
jgi:uncharacterized membrane protein